MNRKLRLTINALEPWQHGYSVRVHTDLPAHGAPRPFATLAERPRGADRQVQRHRPPRLPGYDLQTRRMESGAFFALSFAAVALIVLALGNAAQFSNNPAAMETELSNTSAFEAAGAAFRTLIMPVTNVTLIRISRPAFNPGLPTFLISADFFLRTPRILTSKVWQ